MIHPMLACRKRTFAQHLLVSSVESLVILRLTDHTVRSGLCSSGDLGSFITSLPSETSLNSTSIFTSALKFSASSFPVETPTANSTGDILPTSTTSANATIETGQPETEDGDSIFDDIDGGFDERDRSERSHNERWSIGVRRKRQWEDDVDGIADGDSDTGLDDEVSEDTGYGDDSGDDFEEGTGGGYGDDVEGGYDDNIEGDYSDNVGSELDDTMGSTSTVPVYSAPITYAVRQTGYYCVGQASSSKTPLSS